MEKSVSWGIYAQAYGLPFSEESNYGLGSHWIAISFNKQGQVTSIDATAKHWSIPVVARIADYALADLNDKIPNWRDSL